MANEYIINSKLEEVICKFKEAKLKKAEFPDSEEYEKEFYALQEELAYFFYELSENIIKTFNFKLIDKDDALQEGVVICLEKADRFDPHYVGINGKKTKAFNYMTTCILNHFKQLHRSARNQHELQKRYFVHLIGNSDNVFHEWGSSGQSRAGFKGQQ